MAEMLNSILGYASDDPFSGAIHDLGHRDKVEYLTISPDDVARRRFRLSTDKGTDCAIALDREMRVADGAVLLCDKDRAIVVRLSEREWLTLTPRDTPSALALGYFCGNLHWKVEFAETRIKVALEGPRQTYLDRIEAMLLDGRVSVVDDHG